MTGGAVAITTACSSAGEADRIAAALVGERLAACVQVRPVRSTYRWQGTVEQADEWLVTIKTAACLTDSVTARVRALHSYDLPEVVPMPIVGGAADYLDWIARETAADRP